MVVYEIPPCTRDARAARCAATARISPFFTRSNTADKSAVALRFVSLAQNSSPARGTREGHQRRERQQAHLHYIAPRTKRRVSQLVLQCKSGEKNNRPVVHDDIVL
jgi:hypothetical protein